MVDLAPEFPEVGEASRPHPDDEVLICHIVPLNVLPTADARLWHHVSELCLDVRCPSNAFLVDIDLFP